MRHPLMTIRTHVSLVLTCTFLATAPVYAQTAPAPATPQAEALNDEGKELFKNGNYDAAIEKFRAAIAASPADPRFYFNLCAALEKVNQFDNALEACDSVYEHSPDERLRAKLGIGARKVAERHPFERNVAEILGLYERHVPRRAAV